MSDGRKPGKRPVGKLKSGSRDSVAHNKTGSLAATFPRIVKVIQVVKRHEQILNSDAERRLINILKREDTTMIADFRTPIYRSKSREQVIAGWDERYKTIADSLNPDTFRVLDDIEQGQRSNISPMSPYIRFSEDGVAKAREVMTTVNLGSGIDRSILEDAKALVQSMFAPSEPIKFIPIKQAILGSSGFGAPSGSFDGDGMDLATNAGPPTFGPWIPRQSLEGEALKAAQASIDYILNKRIPYALDRLRNGETVEWYAFTGKRLAQKDDIKKRKRIVIALEKSEPIIWKTFTTHLLKWLPEVKVNGVSPFIALTNQRRIAEDMQTMLNLAETHDCTIVGGDISGYDRSISHELIEMAGEIVGSWTSDPTLVATLAKSLGSHVNVITPYEFIPARPSTMKSGSGGTNLIDSVVLLIVLFYGQIKYGYDIKAVTVQGDDFTVVGPGVVPDVIEQVFKDFGFEANASKQFYERGYVNFLQLTHKLGEWGGVASTYRILGRSLSYERMQYGASKWNGFVDIVATISRLENAWNSPYLEELVDYVSRGDKYRLGADMHPREVLDRSGSVGEDIIQHDVAAAWKSGSKSDGFSSNVVNGVLRGEKLPPQGSRERFLRALGHLAESS